MGGKRSGRKRPNNDGRAAPDRTRKKAGAPPAINVGDIGYTFRKQFDNGWYTGKVVRIRTGAIGGCDRRCLYEDGDSEDLSLTQLQTLALLDPKVTKKKANGTAKHEASRLGDSTDDGVSSLARRRSVYKKPVEYRRKMATLAPSYASMPQASEPVDLSSNDDGLAILSRKNVTRKAMTMKRSAPSKTDGVDLTILSGKNMKKRVKGTDPLPMKRRAPSNTSKRTTKVINSTSVKSEDGSESDKNAQYPQMSVSNSKSSKGEEGDKVRRSKRAVKAPRKIDEIYSYEHIKLAYAAYYGTKKSRVAGVAVPSTPEKRARLLSSTLEDIIPLDKAAESTLNANEEAENSGDIIPSEKNETDVPGEDEDDEKWLEKVAASLGADTSAMAPRKSFRPVHRSSTPSSAEGPPVTTITCRSNGDPANAKSLKQPPEMVVALSEEAGHDPLPLLSECELGNRHGRLVFYKNDKRRKVAEVIFEKDPTWVQVAIDGALKSYRPSQLRVVPSDQFKEGDMVPSNFGKATKRASPGGKKLNKSPASSPGEKTDCSDHLFCWFCVNCNANNQVLHLTCHLCNTNRAHESKRSILLEVAEESIKKDNVYTVEDAMNAIPYAVRPSIPKRLIAYLLKAQLSGANVGGLSLQPKDYSLEQKFYWCCGCCTMQNSYKRTTCSACLQGKGELAERSPLLKIAEEAATNSKTIDEALSLVSPRERPLIPKVVMDTLVTCVFMIEGRNGRSRRCSKKKKDGYDYCEAHCDPKLLIQRKGDFVDSSSCNGSLSQTSERSRGGPHSCIAAISDIMPHFLKKLHKAQVNGLERSINSAEDAVLCGENAAFPLGMKVRKFFEGFGFHDGRIIKVARKLWDDNLSATVRQGNLSPTLEPNAGHMTKQRPILVYRLMYNDGDQEDFLHHEVSSLREIYDNCNVSPEAPPDAQIKPGTMFETRFGTLKVMGHLTPPEAVNKEEGGRLIIQFQDSSKDMELDLLKLQLAVLRKIKGSMPAKTSPTKSNETPSSPADTNQSALKPLLEWPVHGPNKNDEESIEEDDQYHNVCEGLTLHRQRCNNDRCPIRSVDRFSMASSAMNNTSAVRPGCDVAVHHPCDFRPGCNIGMWDPAGCFDHFSWDPYAATICEICGIDKDDNQVVICDECHRGFHTYCLRPVMVNIPNNEWICAECSGRSNTQVSFSDFSQSLREKYDDILKYFGLHNKYKNVAEFLSANSEAIKIFSLNSQSAVKQRAISQGVQAKHITFRVGNIEFIRNPQKNDWRLPTPLLSEEDYMSSILSMAAAMKYCGMKTYTLEHIYSGDAKESMNDPALEIDEITPMSKRNISIYKAYKHNTMEGVFPPVQIIHDENFGFSVKALKSMPRHTIIGEYLGEVVTMEQSSQSNSDSLMVLLDTGDPKTSLIIDPTRSGNIARFLSGINNRSLMSKRKVNVRTRRFFMDGKVHICLFTSRQVDAGEILNYDYNAGNEGKDVDQWARTGFYDTSNFF